MTTYNRKHFPVYGPVPTFAELSDILGTKSERKIMNNTWLVRLGPDVLGIVLHGTTITTIHEDGTRQLFTGGYHTVTTKDRLNRFSPVKVWQQNFIWYVGTDFFREGVTV